MRRLKRHGPSLLALSLLALGAGALLARSRPVEAGPKRRGPRLAVVDIGRLFRDYKRRVKLEELMRKENEALEARITRRKEQVRKLAKELDHFPKGSRARRDAMDAYEEANFRVRLYMRREEENTRERIQEHIQRIIEEIEGVVKTYGERHGFTAIFQRVSYDETESRIPFREWYTRAQVRSILYFDGSLDITQAVLHVLNGKQHLDAMAKKDEEQAAKEPGRPAPQPK